ncbi:MAG: tRNA (adenosine(37)-N6)-threonylcarbamoyltransferase complex ATPase subunit type 1 TsaE, partial [Candidatus Caldatribacteriota bacterium]
MLNNGKSKNHNSNNSLTLISKKPEETRKIGKKIGSLLKRGDLIALNGDLGAGKTCFVQGIASG